MSTSWKMYQAVPELLKRVYQNILMDATFNYFKIRQPGFVPKDERLLNPALYPWGFVESVGEGPITRHRSPSVFKYECTIALVVMIHADLARPETLLVQDAPVVDVSTNRGKGLLDIQLDVGCVLWPHRADNFFNIGNDVWGVNQWTLSRAGEPSVLSVQALLAHPHIRGKQWNITFEVIERCGGGFVG